MPIDFDIAIIGGGLVGSSLALALKHSSLKIILIDATVAKQNDPRLFALNHQSCQLLKNLDLWHQLQAFASPIKQIHVSRRKYFGALRFNHQLLKLPELGNVIPAFHIEKAMNNALLNSNQILTLRPAELISIDQAESVVRLTIKHQDKLITLNSKILIGADGTHSTVRKCLGIETLHSELKQSAIVTRATISQSHGQIAYERFLSQGTIAMLPLQDTNAEYQCASIWSGDTEEIQKLFHMKESDFISHLQNQFGRRLGVIKSISERFLIPLTQLKTVESFKESVLLLGNARHTLHPVAAQGFNLALYEVATLVDLINETTALNPTIFKDFTNKINHQQQFSFNLSKYLSTFFKYQLLTFPVQLGLLTTDILPIIKRRFLSKMMGGTGCTPQLLLSDSIYDKINES